MFPPLDLREGLEIPSLVRRLITQALRTHVHDLHFEPAEEGGRVRIRDDGGLREWEEAAAATGKIPALVRAVKAMAHLEPGETRRPQEGIVVLKTEEGDFSRPVRLRVSILPGPSGETAVLQILREERSDPTLEEAGLSAFVRSRFEPLLREGRGVLLVTGPIGSRKRTTLRATVPLLRGPNVKILSAEDPIFSVIRGVTQAQVDPSLGNTFARYLRAFLDQGADVILCDRIDDGATAQIAFSVGPEGPTILGTTNAGNSTAVVGRMVELGVDRNQVAASLSGILAQRLIRRNCPSCSVPYRPAARVLEEWFRGSIPDVEWRRGSGCDRCGGTGHAGRAIAAELWIPTAEDRYAIGQRLPAEALREQALGGFPCVGQDALRLALQGTITLEEALKVVPYEDVVLARRCGLEPAARRPRGEHEAPIVKVA
ncbi:MAG: ATPase, T2SS/T4P/T4SS family [Candidatus Eisenbacteria bacterium]|nr:ATPase, T2SS/T4P/T4SS family [Candidatus Eisenbacteria bacterium]